jgi:ribosomal protein S27E
VRPKRYAKKRKVKDTRPSSKDRCPQCKHGRVVMAMSGVKCNSCPWTFCY